eukprot:1549005-Pleurochrysis_carterae.AAC.2
MARRTSAGPSACAERRRSLECRGMLHATCCAHVYAAARADKKAALSLQHQAVSARVVSVVTQKASAAAQSGLKTLVQASCAGTCTTVIDRGVQGRWKLRDSDTRWHVHVCASRCERPRARFDEWSAAGSATDALQRSSGAMASILG